MKRPFSVQVFWWRRVLGQTPDIVNGVPINVCWHGGQGCPPPPRKFWNLGPGMGDFQHLISRDNCRLFHAFYTISNFSYFKNTFCPLKFCIGNYTFHLTQGIKNRDVFISIFTLAQENRQNICLSNVSWKVTGKKEDLSFQKTSKNAAEFTSLLWL